MGFKYDVKVDNKWYSNTVVFETEKEAQQAAYNKLFNWTQAQETRVGETTDEVNYRLDFDTGAVIHIATEGASHAD